MPLADRYFIARTTAMERLRLEHPITQADLASHVGVNRASIILIENGKTKKPKDETHKKVCDILRVNYAWLARGEGPMDSELPDYSPPEMKRYGASQTPTLVEKDSENTQYTFTPVIVVSTTESNKEWECIYPEIDNQAAIVTAILPSIDFAALKDEPLFNADVFIKKSQDGVISSAYVLKAYFT